MRKNFKIAKFEFEISDLIFAEKISQIFAGKKFAGNFLGKFTI